MHRIHYCDFVQLEVKCPKGLSYIWTVSKIAACHSRMCSHVIMSTLLNVLLDIPVYINSKCIYGVLVTLLSVCTN